MGEGGDRSVSVQEEGEYDHHNHTYHEKVLDDGTLVRTNRTTIQTTMEMSSSSLPPSIESLMETLLRKLMTNFPMLKNPSLKMVRISKLWMRRRRRLEIMKTRRRLFRQTLTRLRMRWILKRSETGRRRLSLQEWMTLPQWKDCSNNITCVTKCNVFIS